MVGQKLMALEKRELQGTRVAIGEENKKADDVEEEYFSSEDPEKGEEENVSSEEHEKKRLKGPRRSMREKRPAIVSPFCSIPQRKAERKRKTDEKERLFEFCTTRSNKVDGDK